MIKELGICCLIAIACLAGIFAGRHIERKSHEAIQLADFYLKPPSTRMGGWDPNTLATRQAWTSRVLRETAMKIQQDVQALTLRVDKLEDANDAD